MVWQKVLQFLNLKKTQKALVAIDISMTSVKLLELKNSGGRFSVERFSVVPLKPDAVVDKVIQNPEVVSEAIKHAINKADIKAERVAIAIPDSLAINKWMQFDSSLTDDEIESQIVVDADKYIPYPLDEVSYDFVIQRRKPDQTLVDVLLVASRKENVDSFIQVIEAANLELDIVDVQSFVIERVFHFIADHHQLDKTKTIAVIDIGSVMTNLTVIQNEKTIFSREEVFGGELLTKEIQRHYGLSYPEAGLAKKMGTLPEDYVTEVLNPFRETAMIQVKRAIQLFSSSTDCYEINYILLAGGTSCIPGFAELIEAETHIPTLLINPFVGMAISPSVSEAALNKDATALMLCCGLAMRGVDA